MAIPVAVVAVAKTYPAFAAAKNFLAGLKCRIESSCRPRLLDAVKKVGYAGYMYTNFGGGEVYYWQSGEALAGGLHGDGDGWMVMSGYRDKLKAVGVSDCCLAHMPSEAFQVRGIKPTKPDMLVEHGGVKVYFHHDTNITTAKQLIEQQLASSEIRELPTTEEQEYSNRAITNDLLLPVATGGILWYFVSPLAGAIGALATLTLNQRE